MLRFRVTELLVNNEKRWGGHDYDRYGSVQLLAADGIFNHPNASANSGMRVCEGGGGDAEHSIPTLTLP